MAKILVVVEHKEGKAKKVTHEILSQVSRDSCEGVALIVGNPSGPELITLKSDLAAMGAKEILVAASPELALYNNETWAKAVLAAVKTTQPSAILLGATSLGKDLAPRLAAQLGVGLASDCISLSLGGGKISARRPVYAGKATAEVEFLGNGPHIATVRSNALATTPLQTGASVNATPLTVDFSGVKAKTKEVQKGASAKVDLTEANIIVSGGRSMKSSENFEILEKLSAVLPSSAVGASRAAVDAGYRPHSYQVGQTGKVVSPTLYMSFGISGAIQHLAGMRTSKIIVAVNKDPEAPIFQIADYGIVGDLFEVVPLLTQEFAKISGH